MSEKTQCCDDRLSPPPALPAQWCYGLLRALPGVPGLIAPVALRHVLQDLIPASGDQDHTLSPSAAARFV
jgi:hypothetical protein